MTTREKEKTKNERKEFTPPVYPVVDIPVPELDWNKLSGKNSPWYIRLLVSIILMKCCKKNYLGLHKKEFNL